MRYRTGAVCALVATLIAGAAMPASAQKDRVAPVTVCLPAADPPRSTRTGAKGFDVDVARLLVAQLRRPLRLAWLPERGQTDIESTDLVFAPLLAGQCDMQLSIPGADAIADVDDQLALSAPYYGATFELVPADSAFRWGEPYEGTLAVRSNTVAHVAVDAAGIRWTMQERTADIIDAVKTGAATAALVWGPNLALTQTSWNEKFETPAALRWNLHAAGRQDDALLDDLDRLLAKPAIQKAILALLQRHRIPARAPFPATHNQAAFRALLAP